VFLSNGPGDPEALDHAHDTIRGLLGRRPIFGICLRYQLLFAVEEETLPDDLVVTHVNLNDQTMDGVRHREVLAFSVQYHPEASTGPHDSNYLFGHFREMLDSTACAAFPP